MQNKEQKPKRVKKPWPTKEAMEQVYAMKLWGSGGSDFYSGDGSHNPELVDPYIQVITTFLAAFKPPLTVCDLGCGDFNVGRKLVEYTKTYIGVDIVTNLIEYNKNTFKAEQLEFLCLNIATDDLPLGDCVLLRQVLQHLSNAEIQCILKKLSNYTYAIITEHLPEGDFEPNKDILSGQGIRLKKQSGLNVLAPPFNLKVSTEKQLLSLPLKQGKGRIVTTLYKLV